MTHLGDLAAALVDNELSHDARDKALAHLTGCEPCRLEVDAQRRLRSLLANQADPELPSDLAARLRAIATEQAPPAGPSETRRRGPWPFVAAAAFVPAPIRPTGTRRPRASAPAAGPRRVARTGHRVVRRALAGSAVAFALTAGLITAGSSASSSGPATAPPVDRFVQEHTVMTARLPFGDAAAGVVESVVLGR